jgi:hypothetical protein
MDSEKEKEAEATREDETNPVLVCPACGAAARRVNARFCATCGRKLEEQYLPADSLRASYHLHRRATSRDHHHKFTPPTPRKNMSSVLPTPNRNNASSIALAFVTYALVPYLGILFVPGAVLIGGVGLVFSYVAPHRGGRRTAFISIILGFVILGVQVLLWWIIVNVPEWSNPGTGDF